MSSSNPSALFRSVWKGSAGLVGAQGRFRVSQYLRQLRAQQWRDLGTLLVRLLGSLETGARSPSETESTSRAWSQTRCLIALAVTVRYMQTAPMEELSNPAGAGKPLLVVDPAFVTSLFAGMVRRAVAATIGDKLQPAIALVCVEVLCAIQACLSAADNSCTARFPRDAVIRGLLGPPIQASEAAPSHLAKRARLQKQAAPSSAAYDNMATLLQLLAYALGRQLHQETDSACKSALRILRANPDISSRLMLPPVASPLKLLRWQVLLVCALADRADESLGRQRQGTATDLDDLVFACLRDMVPLIPVAAVPGDHEELSGPWNQLLDRLAKLTVDLAALFRPLVAGHSVYAQCAAQRRMCYQWIVLCRLTTWAEHTSHHQALETSAESPLTEAVAEGGRVCWLLLAYAFSSSSGTHCESPLIWLLLVAESLSHIALEYPASNRSAPPLHSNGFSGSSAAATPLFLETEECQVKVFTVVAMVLSHTSRIVNRQKSQDEALVLLLPGVARACMALLRLMNPAAASLGLFKSALALGATTDDGLLFGQSGSTIIDYVFRADIVSEPVSQKLQPTVSHLSDSDSYLLDKLADQLCETIIANVFVSFDCIARALCIPPKAAAKNSKRSNGLSLVFRAVLRWICLFASSARDNVGRQTRALDRRCHQAKSRNIADFHQPTTDWSRLQRIPTTRFNESTDFCCGNDGSSAAPPTYHPVIARVLRMLTALALWDLLGAEHCPLALERVMLPEDTENCTGAGLPAERNVCAQSAIRLCRRLKDLTSVDEFSSVAMSSLQVLGNIMGMRSHLVARDIAHLRLPHLYVREHIPRSIASLTQLTVQIGLGQLMLEPRLLVHFTSRVRDGSILQSPAMLRAMQMWLDIIGFVLRYSSLRTHSGVFVTASNASAISSKSIPGQLTFPDWWPLALAASAQCLNDAVAAPNDSALDISKLRLACIMPSHILSWYMHLPLSLDASSPALAKLFQPALESDNGRHGGLTNENIGAVNDNYALQQLHACLASFPQPNPPSQSASVVHPVYLLACRLWLNVKLFEQPLKATRDTHSQQLVLQICRDIWGISSDALHLLSRMVLTQPTMRGAFVALGLVGDFSRDVLVRLVSNQGYPGLLSRVLQARQNQLDIESARRLSLGNISDLVTIPQVEMRNEKNELEYRSDSDSDLGLPQPSSTTDVVDKLLADFAHASDCTKRRPTTEYYSMPMLGRLWIELIERLLKFPTSALFVRPVAASEPRSSSLSTTPAARALAGSHGELSEWLDDPGNILYATLTPLLAVRESLVLPSSFWTAMSDTIPVSDVIRTINTNARHEGGKASLRMCVSAAFLLPEFTAAPDLLRSEMEAVAAALFDSLVHGLLLLPAENDDESRHEQCLMALLFLAWRQRRCISEQVALCATQLRREVVAMGEDLASGQPCLSAIQEHLTTHSSIDDVYAGDVVWLSGKASSGCDREPVATSPTLLVSHSPVLKAMLTGEFAEAQAIASSKARQVSLQCDHATLARMLDILHRYATMGSAVAEGTAAEERLRVALERDFTPDQLAEVFELAVYYNLRPVVIFLAWKLAAGFGVESLAAVSSDPASLSRLARLLGDGWLVHRMPDSAAQAIQQTLTAVLLLRLDEIDSISVPEDATFSFASAALSLMKRTQ